MSSPRNRLCEKSRILRLMETAVFAAAEKSFSGWGGLKRFQQRRYSEDVDDPFEIVAQHAQGQFGFGFFQSAEQEQGMGHQPFHGPERVLSHFPPVLHPHRISRRPPMHR